MARQKPSVDAVKRNEPQWRDGAQNAEIHLNEKDPSNEESPMGIETDSEEDIDSEYADRSPSSLLTEGKLIRKKDISKAIKLFDAALRLKIRNDNLEQTDPELGEFWLCYGDALYTKEEESCDLFQIQSSANAKEQSNEDDKETAWQCLDLARICFEKLLANASEQGQLTCAPIENVWVAVDEFLRSRSLWTAETRPSDVGRPIEDTIFTRLRLGDCNQAETQFERATEDFAESLRLCMAYRVSLERALEPSIPLCHCLLALDSERTEKMFAFAILLIDAELSLKTSENDLQRAETLKVTKEDLQAQLKDFVESHEMVKREAREAIMALVSGHAEETRISGAGLEDATQTEANIPETTIDLGIIRKKRKKPDPPPASSQE
eukprot:Gregarina_sp_Poly_1__10179@NODE_6_length_24954_cov_45_443846_g5_i0_p4_GENE_NODE_6_length_24954_cov_45_443846_g5_i0NODE_6_length_24954_cov_45_443846_g5_i0_p4_ORF_typecomplete_len380_score75_55TPR_16/PF13432_6/0_0049TPR_16/PF13432_6/8_3TPR_19/PF14559_6/1_4TPR_19/PF14559_6/1_3e04TPR_19/PF14559_6/86TPR_12/PF13424_6/22TPR_12/PF13424_6/2_9e03TPR_12/PF13424_6/16SHNiTPR/PF10516_9/8_4e03SHNiTPR/PF10516_9/0_22TPR_8/PF13181_6/18TPR_8/PF13181_6/3_7e03TPR_8/PF13181_6/73TPR_2/PF07719_17/5_7TPR_2/PF07719_17/3_